MKKKEIAKTLDSMDLKELAFKLNAFYRQNKNQKWIPLQPVVNPYVMAGIGQQQTWEQMAELVLKEVKKALDIRPLRREER